MSDPSELNLIQGAGGGGKGSSRKQTQRSPVEQPDSLRSKQFARLIDALCEGEILGLVSGFQSIYFDKTPLENADGTLNFDDVVVVTRNGLQDQPYIEGFPAIESEQPVGIQILNASPLVRTITNADVDAVRVTVGIPRLTRQDEKTGDLEGNTVRFAIDVQSNGGGYVTKFDFSITGKTTSRYQFSREVLLDGEAPWNIRVRRISGDDNPANWINDIFWDSYTEVFYDKLTFSNTALAAISIDAAQFSRIPNRAYHIRGLIVRVPSNYDAGNRTYDGTWDGSFKLAYTNNPVWCLYDLLTNTRYGLGKYIDPQYIDKWNLYNIAQYCDEMVPDGVGGVEPRFTLNCYIQSREDAYKVINAITANFWGSCYWHSGSIFVTCDMPSDVTHIFNNSNVVDGTFTYAGSAKTARHTVALVSWNDPDDFYAKKVEYVEDHEGIVKYGYHETEIDLIGCTSRGQAHRHGKRALYTELYETETVTFRTGLDGLLVYPGAIIQTHDTNRAGVRWGGRVIQYQPADDDLGTPPTIIIDSPVVLESLKTYTLTLIDSTGEVVTRTLTNLAGSTSSLTFAEDFAQGIQPFTSWMLESDDLLPRMWRVLSMTEVERHVAEITALEFHPGKYDFIENNIALEERPTSLIQTVPPAPENVIVTDTIRRTRSGEIVTYMTVSFDQPSPDVALAGELTYVIGIQSALGNWEQYETIHTTFDIPNVREQEYRVRVYTINSLGYRSRPSKDVYHTVLGKLAPPSPPEWITVTQQGNNVVFTCANVDDPDLDYIAVGYSDQFVNDWDGVIPIGNIVRGESLTSAKVPPGNWRFWARSYDTSGIGSDEFATVDAFIDSGGFNVIRRRDEAPAWSGTKTNLIVHPSGTMVPDNVGIVNTFGYTAFDTVIPSPAASCEYISHEMDKGIETATRVWIDIVAALAHGETGNPIPPVQMDFKGESSNYDGFEDWSVGEVYFRYAKGKMIITPADGVGVYSSLIIATDNFSRTESRQHVVVPAAGLTISFIEPFNLEPNLQVTLLGGTFAVRFLIGNSTNASFQVQCYDNAGDPTQGIINWRAEGV